MMFTNLPLLNAKSFRARATKSPSLCVLHRVAHKRYGRVVTCAAEENRQEFGLAPAKPKTAYGEMLQYYLKMQPELFKSAVEDQLNRLKKEKESKEAAKSDSASAQPSTSQDQASIVLSRRMEEIRASEFRATVEDLMYVSILEKFVLLGVEMLPRMDGFVDVAPTNLKALTEGIHSKEALELVREHLLSVMGATAMAQFSNTVVKMSKFQMAQVYAASIMFGYFLRRVDKRFELEKQLGSLEASREDAVARLEKLFAAAEAAENIPEDEMLPGGATFSASFSSGSTVGDVTSSGEETSVPTSDWVGGPVKEGSLVPKTKNPLRRYIESFDQAAMQETARIVTKESAALVERQTSAVLGDIKQLTAQVQETVGQVQSMQEVMMKLAQAVAEDSIPTLTMTVGTQRRAVLEACAFGALLRDTESWIDTEYGLLTLRAPLMLGSAGDDSSGFGLGDDQ